ncbi:MAG: DUF3459 domain-containing protein, partial [Anaerolineae bacterium]
YRQRNVAAQLTDPHSMLQFTRALIRLRREHEALRRGEFVALTLQPQDSLAYLRRMPGQSILVALNFSNHPARIPLPQTVLRRPWTLLLSTHRENAPDIASKGLLLAPYEVCLLKMP